MPGCGRCFDASSFALLMQHYADQWGAFFCVLCVAIIKTRHPLHLEIQRHRRHVYGLIRSSYRENGRVKHTTHGRLAWMKTQARPMDQDISTAWAAVRAAYQHKALVIEIRHGVRRGSSRSEAQREFANALRGLEWTTLREYIARLLPDHEREMIADYTRLIVNHAQAEKQRGQKLGRASDGYRARPE